MSFWLWQGRETYDQSANLLTIEDQAGGSQSILQLGAGNDVDLLFAPFGQVVDTAVDLSGYTDQWSHIVITFGNDGVEESARLYLNGVEIGAETAPLGSRNRPQQLIFADLLGRLDELMLYQAVLDGAQVADLSNPLATTVLNLELSLRRHNELTRQFGPSSSWRSVSFDASQQVGGWSYTVPPSTAAGVYEIDLRVTDSVGNRIVYADFWTGLLDPTPPSIASFNVGPSQDGNGLDVTCVVENEYLAATDATFGCPLEPTEVISKAVTANLEIPLAEKIVVHGQKTGLPNDATLVFEVCDVAGNCGRQIYSQVNYPPTAVNDSAWTPDNKPLTLAVLTNDSDLNGDVLTITNFTQPISGTVTISGTHLIYTPVLGGIGSMSFTYQVEDQTSISGPASVNVEVLKSGDVSCDQRVSTVDALFVLQQDVQLRSDEQICPLSNAATQLDARACDVNLDGRCSTIDALFILQCDVGVPNTFCPTNE